MCILSFLSSAVIHISECEHVFWCMSTTVVTAKDYFIQFSSVAVLGNMIPLMLFKQVYLTQNLPEDSMGYSTVYFRSIPSILVITLGLYWLQLISSLAIIHGFSFPNSCILGYCSLSYNHAVNGSSLNTVFCSSNKFYKAFLLRNLKKKPSRLTFVVVFRELYQVILYCAWCPVWPAWIFTTREYILTSCVLLGIPILITRKKVTHDVTFFIFLKNIFTWYCSDSLSPLFLWLQKAEIL